MAQVRKRGWWYPWIFVGFFAVVISVNGIMMYIAVGTFTGLETEGHYVKGLKYNDNIEGVKKQQEMGWQDQTTWSTASQDGSTRSGKLEVVLIGKNGEALSNLNVKAMIIRPTHVGYDIETPLERRGDGRYDATLTLPLPGLWDVRILASKGEDAYQRVQRLTIK